MKTNTTYTAGSLARLSELASILDCSLVRYLSNARPWRRRPYLTLAEATRRLADEHGRYAGAIVGLLHQRRYSLGAFTFPMEFTSYNDLSLEYLAPRLLDDQKRLAATAKEVFSELAEVGDHEAHRQVEALLISLRRYDGLMEVLLAADRVAEPPAMPKDNAISRKRHGWAGTKERYDSTSLQPQTAA